MSDHAWTHEHVAAYLAGGLDAAERERFDAHVAGCPDCAAEVAAARAADRAVDALFAPARPGPALEDRLIRSLRVGGVRRSAWPRKLAWGVAATVGLGAVGAGVSATARDGGLRFPGGAAMAMAIEPPTFGDAYLNGAVGSNVSREVEVVVSGKDALPELGLLIKRASPPSPPGSGFGRGGFGGGGFGGSRGFAGAPGGLGGPSAGPAAGEGGPGAAPGGFDARSGRDGKKGGAEGTTQWYFRPGEAKPGDMPRLERGDDAKYAPPPPAAPAPPVLFARPTLNEAEKLGKNVAFGATVRPALQTPKPDAPQAADQPPGPKRVVIRSGEIEFEVEAFDPAVATITKLVAAIPGAFVATVNSDKLPNGKVKGTITVRIPPDALDGLVLDLRRELGKAGELKGQKIGSQDVTKQYTDLESRLKAARTMETRLLEIIKTGKGEIKQLLEAEKELGVWRTKIEEIEGELRYYANLASLSTLSVVLAEKEIRAAAGITESERVQAGVEVEDVDQAFRAATAAVAEFKGRVTKSELKQLAAGQFNATLHFEVAPDAAGPMRDRLRQLGRVARLEIDRVQAANGPVTKETKVTRGDAVFLVQLYNLANVAPRETAALSVAVVDVPAGFRAVREAVEKAKGRILTAQVNEGDRQNVTAQLDFEVKRADEGAVQAALAAAGDVVSRQVTRAPESDNVTDTKVLYRTSFVAAARLTPRETTTLAVEVGDVDQTAAVFAAQVAEAKGRVVDSQVTHERTGKVTAKLVYDVPLAAAAGVVERMKGAGTVRVQQTVRDPQATDGKFATARLDVALTNEDRIVPKDDGLWPQVRKGLAYSVESLLASVTWLIYGLCVVLPWAVVVYLVYRLIRRAARPNTPPAG